MEWFRLLLSHQKSIYAGIIILLFFTSCKQTPETFAIHSPVYPSSTAAVTYTLHKLGGSVESVKLYVSTSNVDASGNVTGTTTESLIKTWASPSSFPLSFTSSSGYGANKLVTYHFEIRGNNHTYNHRISFATNPYPVANVPAPVYTVGDADRVMNVVFIPDTDIAGDINTFYTHVARDIDSAFHREDWIRRFPYSYNFYINPFTGHAGDYNAGTAHTLPSNSTNLSFAQANIILHSGSWRDFRSGSYIGTEYYNRGTILHETGHALYNMADEYEGGSHWQNADLPNTWSSLSGAQSAASGVGKSASDAVKIGGDAWWKLCNNQCMMLNTGLIIYPYDKPCQNRILFSLLQRAGGN